MTLSCPSLATGITCTFNPSTVTPASGGNATSILTVNTAVGTPAMQYSIGITGMSGTISHSISQNLIVQPPQIELSPSGPSSATISSGQTANFTLTLTALGGLSGTASLSCTISPTPASAPTCTVPGTVQLSASGPSQVPVMVATTAPVTGAEVPWPSFPRRGAPFAWTVVLAMCWTVFMSDSRRRITSAMVVVLAVVLLVSCGGGTSSSHTTPGTPAGTYTATVTAKLGSDETSTTLTVIVP